MHSLAKVIVSRVQADKEPACLHKYGVIQDAAMLRRSRGLASLISYRHLVTLCGSVCVLKVSDAEEEQQNCADYKALEGGEQSDMHNGNSRGQANPAGGEEDAALAATSNPCIDTSPNKASACSGQTCHGNGGDNDNDPSPRSSPHGPPPNCRHQRTGSTPLNRAGLGTNRSDHEEGNAGEAAPQRQQQQDCNKDNQGDKELAAGSTAGSQLQLHERCNVGGTDGSPSANAGSSEAACRHTSNTSGSCTADAHSNGGVPAASGAAAASPAAKTRPGSSNATQSAQSPSKAGEQAPGSSDTPKKKRGRPPKNPEVDKLTPANGIAEQSTDLAPCAKRQALSEGAGV